MSNLPSSAQVVIVGGGIVGCSVAYHLARRGCTDVVLLERRQLTCGTTWHAAGLVGQLRSSHNMTRLARYSAELYGRLEAETGQATGFRRTGSLALATDAERFEELRRNASMARSFGLEVEVVTPRDVGRHWPMAAIDDVVGAVYLSGDGQTNPVDTTLALAKGARGQGVRIIEDARVTRIVVENGRASGVEVGDHRIRADHVVLCAGMWTREIAGWIDVSVPLHAAEHFYIVTEPVPGLKPGLPILRDGAACAYFKEDAGKLLVGWFEPIAKPWGMNGIPDGFCFDQLPEDLSHIEPLLDAAIRRVPMLGRTGIQLFFNGPESFTPDDRYLLGESPEVGDLFVAAGFNSIGIQSAGGAGKVLADWVLDGHPPMDLWDVDIRRMMSFQRNAKYLHDRTRESLGLLYAMHWPFRQPETARGVRRSALHDRLLARGACFGEVAGYERPNWFASPGQPASYVYSFGRPNWFARCAEECEAVRDDVGLFDLSSFAKFVVEGSEAEAALNRICANDVAVPVGRIVYTQWLNDRGGIEADLTVTRETETRYLVVTACAAQARDFAWLRRGLGQSVRAVAIDVSSGYAVLALMGPRSRSLLQSLTQTDLSPEAFPFATSQVIDLGYARVRASRITYVGELGWELYIPAEFAQGVFDVIESEGESFRLRHVGYHALNALRMEKAYRHWGDDLTDEDTPLEAGLGFAVGWRKSGGFNGRDALMRQRERGPNRRLVSFALSSNTHFLYRNEPIWRDGACVGRITSGMYGHRVGRSLGMGYVGCDGPISSEFIDSGQYEIEIAGERVPAVVSRAPFYDPDNLRVRA